MRDLGDRLTSTEAAALLRITGSTIRAQIRRGRLEGAKRGGIWWFARGELERYAKENQVRRKGGRAASLPKIQDGGAP